MANPVPHVVGFNPSAIGAAYYTGGVMANGAGSATEAEVQFYVTKPGTFTMLTVNITAQNASGDTTLTFRKNGADGNNTVTFASGVTGVVQDTTHSDSVTTGDLINFQLSYTSGTATFSSWTILFQATDGSTTQFVMAAGAPAGFAVNTGVRYIYPVGTLITSLVTESLSENMIQHDCVASDFAVYAINNRAASASGNFRINGASALGVSITASTTALFRNAVNTSNLSATDLINFMFTNSGGGGVLTVELKNFQITLTSDTPEEVTIMGGSVFTRSSTASALYGRVAGSLGLNSGTEAQNRIMLAVDGDISKMAVYVSANASNRDMDILMRISGASGTNTVNNTQATTGWLQDTTHTDAVVAANFINFRSLVTSGGAGSGNVTYNAFSFLLTLPSSGSSSVSPSVSPSASTSPSSSSSLSVSPSASVSPSSSSSLSVSPSSSLSLSVSPSSSSSRSVSPSASISPSASVSPSASPSVGYHGYTKGDYAVLPANDTDLENAYTAQDVIDVATDDDVRVAQTALSEYAIHQYKDFASNKNSVTVEWRGQTNLLPSSSTVFLQIYNRNTTTWETVDSDNSSATGTDFILIAFISDLTNYKDINNVISCRVYQLDI